MAQATCRIPPALDNALEAATDEVGVFRSELIRRALIHYIRANPDEIQAFSQETVSHRDRAGDRDDEPARSRSFYDPITDV